MYRGGLQSYAKLRVLVWKGAATWFPGDRTNWKLPWYLTMAQGTVPVVPEPLACICAYHTLFSVSLAILYCTNTPSLYIPYQQIAAPHLVAYSFLWAISMTSTQSYIHMMLTTQV